MVKAKFELDIFSLHIVLLLTLYEYFVK